jgi:hypothetical protein
MEEEGVVKIDSPRTHTRKMKDALLNRSHSRSSAKKLQFSLGVKRNNNEDTVVEAIKKKKFEAENKYEIVLRTLTETYANNDEAWQNAIQWLEEQVIDQCDDPNKIDFYVIVFNETEDVNFFMTRCLRVIKDRGIDELNKSRNEDKIRDYLQKYQKHVLELMQTFVAKWNEKHPTLLAEVVIPERYDVQYYISNKKI